MNNFALQSNETRSISNGTVANTASQPVLLRDQAYQEIKERILRCDLMPGASVTVATLAEDLGFGRSPILNAIDRLVSDGLVQTLPRKGIVVSAIGFNELIDIVEVRMINECQAARWAAQKATSSDVSRLEDILEQAGEAAGAGDVDASVRLDRAFHRMISAIAGNRILEDLLKGLHERSLRFWYVSLRERDHGLRVYKEHRAIVDAIRAGDADAADAALRAHISSFHQNVTTRALRA